MSKRGSGRDGYRNLLYEEPSAWGAFVLIGIVFAIAVAILGVLLI